MASPTAPFSFHCVICVEAFNLVDRPPVVLPCGHTYICEQCSKRIDRCMECRTSLFVKPAPSQSPSMDNYNMQGLSPGTPVSRRAEYLTQRRYGQHTQLSPVHKKQVEQIPLPLPRNIVLIALMEAASKRYKATANLMDDISENSIADDDQIVLNSIAVLSSTCGTYIVRERYGLPIYGSTTIDSQDGIEIGLGNKPVMVLVHGQRIQVVDVHEGVYRLARNEGVVFANSMQLVKVGIAQERSCKVEGMINEIQTSKAELSQQMNDLLHAEANLRSELDYSLGQPASHPIIEACPPPQDQEMILDQDVHTRHSSTPSDKFMSTFYSSSRVGISDDSMDSGTPTPATPPPLATPKSRKSLVFDDTVTPVSTPRSEPVSPFVSPFGGGLMCGSSLLPIFRHHDDEDEEPNRLPIRRMGSSDDDTRRLFETVDFRTGFSGHIALNQARKTYPTNIARGTIRMMGEHRGIASIKNMRNQPTGAPNSPGRLIKDKASW